VQKRFFILTGNVLTWEKRSGLSDATKDKDAVPAVTIPEKYKSPATSPIVVDLKEGAGRFEFKID
jgi:hypothetical protein